MRTATDAGKRLESLRFIHAEMLRQVISGECVSAYREHAFPLLEAPELLEQLRQIHRERPDLYVAWSQLCLHLLDMGEGKQAMQLAEDATRRFARLPGAWLGAARTRRALGDHKGAAEFARTASALNPHWDEAWIRRADYLEDAGQPDEAIAVLEEARKRLPASGRIIAFLASMRWRLRDRSRAFEDMMAAARLMQGDSGVWEDAVEWARTLGREDEVIEAARALTRERPGDPDSWMLLARLLPDAGITEKLAVFDRAIALKPRLTEAWDQKARILALKGRYKEAKEACHPPSFNGEPPYNLLGREAWICYREGSRTAAMEAMEKLLEKHPDYHWGWICLQDWAAEAKDKERTLRAQAALQRLSPRDVRTLCEIGDHLLGEGKETDALAKYEEAMLLSPGAPYPLGQWLRLRWSRREIDRILSIRDTVLPGASRVIADAYAVLAHLHRGNKAEAESILRSIVRSPEHVLPVVHDLAEALPAIGHARLWRKTLAVAARDGEIGMSFATGWVASEIESARYDAWKKFDGWIARAHDDAEDPISRYFSMMGEKGKMRKAGGFFKTDSVKWVKGHTVPFGNVGYALANARWWDMAVVWLEGAEKRDDAVGWLCTNLMLAHLERREFDQAFAVAHGVVARDLRDHTWACTIALAALGKAMDGEAARAKEILSMIEGPDNNTTWKWIWTLAEELAAVLALEPASREARKRHAVAAKRLSCYARENFPGMSHGFLRLWFKVQSHMSRHSGRSAFFDRWRMPLRAWLPL
jgi:tetratricopeptide (TPR) repeat protein